MPATKREWRAELRAARRAVLPGQRQLESGLVGAQVLTLPEVLTAQSVHVYLSLPDEVDTAPIISALMEMGIEVVVPWMEDDGSMSSVRLLPEDVAHIVIGPRGVPAAPEPRTVVPGQWDVVLVPLVGVDERGTRLGNAAGHYDRLLAAHRRPSVALAFDCQVVEQLPAEDHDIPMDVVVTPQGVWRAPPARPGDGPSG